MLVLVRDGRTMKPAAVDALQGYCTKAKASLPRLKGVKTTDRMVRSSNLFSGFVDGWV